MMSVLFATLTMAGAIVPQLPTLAEVGAEVQRAWVLDPGTPLLAAPGGDAVQPLHVGTEVDVLEVRGELARVRAYGTEGWIDLRKLSAERPDVEILRALARRGPAAERVLWAERAAATSFGGYDQRVLAATLREIGEVDRAEELERSLGLPSEIWLAPITRTPDLRIEYAVGGWPPREAEGPLSPAELEAYDLQIGQTWWVLPVQGPAVVGRVTGASSSVINECGGSWAIEVHLEADLPPGTDVLAFSRGEPPASWRAEVAEPVGRELVVERFRLRAEALGLAAPEVDAVGSGSQWWGRAASVTATEPDGAQGVRVVDMSWDGRELRVLEDDAFHTYSGWSRPFAVRDLDGDGDLESVWTECSRVAREADGTWITSTESRCCGC